MSVMLEPIGVVVGGRDTLVDDDWAMVRARIRLSERFAAEAVAGLDAFSHVEVIFVLDRVAPQAVQHGARHPRGNPAWPRVGIFAQRAKDRPNRLAVSRCRLLAVTGRELAVEGLDALDGSPVLDVKPWMDEFAPLGATRQPPWATRAHARLLVATAPRAPRPPQSIACQT
jgi:tRNA (adenine37-N6)-methyltransferase